MREPADEEDRPPQKESRVCIRRELLWSQTKAAGWAPISVLRKYVRLSDAGRWPEKEVWPADLRMEG